MVSVSGIKFAGSFDIENRKYNPFLVFCNPAVSQVQDAVVSSLQSLINHNFQSGNCSPQGPAASGMGEVGGVTTTPATSSTSTTTPAASQSPPLRHILPLNPLLKGPTDPGPSAPCPIKAGGSGDPCPLPVKSLRPKNTNPSQDPNTVWHDSSGHTAQVRDA